MRQTAFAVVALAASSVGVAEEKPDFNRDVRPILSDRCFSCHGPDQEDRQAGLRLDLREGATAVLESGGKAVVPGDPAASEVIARITSTDPDVVMPPPRLNKPITPAEAEILRRWIATGAEYRGHWAFERVERPTVPAVKDMAWPKTPIDRFVLARLEQEGLAPNAEADRVTLARRVALDLTGLPPATAAVDAFLADASPEAYEKYIDGLLASPHYGERMAIEWLDAARYADSSGYQTDSSRQNWPWRDWLIKAYNDNVPFDQFTIHQLAGDMLENPTRDQIVATGFNRNHRLNGEGGIIAEEWRVETVIDRVETTGQTWMALSVGCARCHDHKFDPLSQKDFYSLFALFNNVPETGTNQGDSHRGGGNVVPVHLLPSPEQESELARLQTVVADAETAVKEEAANIDALVAKWEESIRPALTTPQEAWELFEPLELRSAGGASFRRSEDGSWFVEGKLPPKDTYEFETLVPADSLGGIRIEVLPDASLAGDGGFSRGGNGNIVVTKIEAEIEPPGDAKVIPVELVRAEASYAQNGWPASSVLQLKGEKGKGWAIDGNDPEKRLPRQIAVFPAKPVTLPENARLVVRVRQEAIDGHSFGRFRLTFSSDDPAMLGVDGSTLPQPVKDALAVNANDRAPQQKAEIAKFYRANVDGPIRRAETARDAAKKSVESFTNTLPSAMVMKEGPVRDAFVLIRGEYDKRGDRVTAALPAFLPKLPDGTKPDRLALANWLVSRDHPLTSRVWVNRMWERFFGTGLSKTSENLGSQAEYPSHPELLDWLAAEFMETGWDMKRFMKLVVTSAVYRQNAVVTPEKLAKDPANRLLARAPRIRLPGEAVRDAALAAGGLLVPAVGGPSVRPWMPDGVWDETSKYGDLRGYKPDDGPGRYRRTMYTIWKRTAGPPTMLLFDAPSRETCIVKRSRTNTPLQALALLNETTFVEAAHGLAKRMIAEGGSTPAERIAHGFRLAIGRKPTDTELAALVDGFEADLAAFKATPERAEKYAAVGLVAKPEALAVQDFAAYSLAANVIINLDEFVMRE
ncbi:MAG: PSD1 and planctomycete cytochrome C domain-containing protein [Planctomycetia bacterium]|nr:PSD1 and planctomycete cytochrome C domain-containing protein [Planctomycetia bacterium]